MSKKIVGVDMAKPGSNKTVVALKKGNDITVIEVPNFAQMRSTELSGWEYLGDGLFEKDGLLGYFTVEKGFVKE